MKREVTLCDFCGNEIEDNEQSWRIVANDNAVTPNEEDCCYDCYHAKFKKD